MPVDLGLHLNFTEPLPGNLVVQPLARLLYNSFTARLDMTLVAEEIARQLDMFEDVVGAAPAYVDGHQHVHQLPVIREGLLAVLVSRYPDRLPWLRSTLPPAGLLVGGAWVCALKASLIGALGDRALRQAARAQGFVLNRRLLGVYGFKGGEAGYRSLLATWLSQAGAEDLLVCHPAAMADEKIAFGAQRFAEYRVLAADSFAHLLEQYHVSIGRLSSR